MGRDDLVKKFDELFKTSFHKQEKDQFDLLIQSKKRELDLADLNSDNFLLILSYLYLEVKNFSINEENEVQSYSPNFENELKKLFKKPLILDSTSNGFILIVTKRAKEGELDPKNLYKNVKAYKGSDIIYFNKKTKRITYTNGPAKQKIKELINNKKLFFVIPQPKEISFDPIEKILNSKKIDIFEVEFRSLNFENVRGLYLKSGSKETKINLPLKRIRNILLRKNILRVSNIKRIHIGLKNSKRNESTSLIITTPEKLGVFRIKWKGKPLIELDNLIKNDILKEILNIDLIDKGLPFSEILLPYLGKEVRNDQFESIKPRLHRWDKNRLLKYEKNRLVPDYEVFESILTSSLEKYFFIRKTKLHVAKNSIREAFFLKSKEDSKEVFLFLSKRKISDELQKTLYKKLPHVIIDFHNLNTEKSNWYNPVVINDKGIEHFIDFIKNACTYSTFFKNQKNNFLDAKEKLVKIEKIMGRITNQKKGALWEGISGAILDFIFRRTEPLSGPNLPDGISFLNGKNGLLWDAKALFTKKLKDSISGIKKPKDIIYTEIFKKKLKIDYYAFLTLGIAKSNFDEAEKILNDYKTSVRFCCITHKALLDLSEIFSDDNKARIFHKNLDKFCDNLKLILNNGYVDSIRFDDLAKDIENDLIIDKKRLRKEVKKLANV